MKRETFARRVRAILDQKKLNLAELATRAELDPSLISKLLTDTDASRREPRVEHVLAIARALEKTPRELVAGTSADGVLSDWVPKEELEAESKLRTQLQARVSNLETDLTASKAEAVAAGSEVIILSRQLAETQESARRETAELRIANQKASAELAAVAMERDNATLLANALQEALSRAKASLLEAQRELTAAKGSASAGWLTAVIAGIGAYALGSSAPKRRS